MRIFDLHQDLLYHLYRQEDDVLKDYLNIGIHNFVMAIFPFRAYYKSSDVEDALRFTIRSMEFIRDITKEYGFKVAESKEDLNTPSVIMGLEGAYGIENIQEVKALYRLGLRLLGLVWNKDNLLAAHWGAERDYGLTDFGYRVVKLARELGMVIDLAHASDRTFRDVVENFDSGILVSHTGLRHLKNSKRNITMEMIEAIESRRGIVGIALAKLFLGNSTLEEVAKEIAGLMERFPDTIALGSDYFGFSTSQEIKGLENIYSLGNLHKALSRYLNEDLIEKFFWKNAYEFFRNSLK